MVAIAIVLVVLFATVSMRGRQRRGAKLRDEIGMISTPHTSERHAQSEIVTSRKSRLSSESIQIARQRRRPR